MSVLDNSENKLWLGKKSVGSVHTTIVKTCEDNGCEDDSNKDQCLIQLQLGFITKFKYFTMLIRLITVN